MYAFFSACPNYGSFIAWKRCGDKILKLKIPEDAERINVWNRECRANKALVLSIENEDGTDSNLKSIHSNFDYDFIYELNKMIVVEDYDNNPYEAATRGVHFWMTREEAVNYLKIRGNKNECND